MNDKQNKDANKHMTCKMENKHIGKPYKKNNHTPDNNTRTDNTDTYTRNKVINKQTQTYTRYRPTHKTKQKRNTNHFQKQTNTNGRDNTSQSDTEGVSQQTKQGPNTKTKRRTKHNP